MSGYDGFSMSNRARDAYRSGLRPASKIGRVPADLIRRFVPPEEWHHTSVRFNRTEFYSPRRVLAVFGLAPHPDYEADPEAVAALAAHRAGGDRPRVHTGCTVEWIEWGGTLHRPKAYPQRATGCTVAVKGRTATVTLPNGRRFRKRLSTAGFRFAPEG
ncbi:MAG: hypothetical protein N2688_00030 [Burkholderiaceae bacterium]|nr:hypothetical protein [Burkholderiaceae bacterium]